VATEVLMDEITISLFRENVTIHGVL